MYLYIVKAIYNKHTTNIISSGEDLKTLRSWKRQECPVLPIVFTIVLYVLEKLDKKKIIKHIN